MALTKEIFFLNRAALGRKSASGSRACSMKFSCEQKQIKTLSLKKESNQKKVNKLTRYLYPLVLNFAGKINSFAFPTITSHSLSVEGLANTKTAVKAAEKTSAVEVKTPLS